MTSPQTSGNEPPRRRPFESSGGQSSFFGSTEFQRILWFAGLLVFLTLFALYFAGRAKQANQPPQPVEAPPPPELLSQQSLDERRAKLSTLFEGALGDTQNGDDFKETPGYRRLIQSLTAYSPEEVSARATRTLDYTAFMAQPDAYRGEFVRVRGVVSHMFTEKLREPIFDVTDVYRGFLSEADGSIGTFFDLPTPPPGFEMRRGAIDVEGIFYRTVRYENQRGDIKEVPYVLARNMREVVSAPAHHMGFLSDHTAAVLVGMALAIFCVRLLMYLAQRRRGRARPTVPGSAPNFRDMFDEKLREERRRSGRPPPPLPPA
jgi:hypothetical protein